MRLKTSPPSCVECHEILERKPRGTLWATPGLLRGSFTFTGTKHISALYLCKILITVRPSCIQKFLNLRNVIPVVRVELIYVESSQ